MAARALPSFARGALSYSAVVALGAAIGVLTTPFTTRVYDPATLGRVNLFGAYLALMQVLSLIGLDQGYMRFYSERVTAVARFRLLRHCMTRSALAWSLWGVMLWFLWRQISVSIAGEPRWDVVVVLLLASLGSTLFRFAQVWSRVSGLAGDFLRLTLVFAILTKVSVVAAGILSPDYMTGILFLGCGYVIVGVYAVVLVLRRAPRLPTEEDSRGVPDGRPLLRYSLPFLATGLLSLVATSLVSIPVERFLGFDAVGVLGAGLSLASFVVVLQMGIQSYWAPYAYAIHRIGPNELRSAQQVVILVMCAVGLLAVAASPVLFLLVGAAFRPAADFFGLLLAPGVLALVGEVGGIGLLLAKRSWLYSAAQGIGAVVTVLGCIWLLPISGLVGAGTAMTLGALTAAALRVALARASFRPFARPSRALGTAVLFLVPVALQALSARPFAIPAEVWASAALGTLLIVNRLEVARIGAAAHREFGAVLGKLRGRPS